MSDINTIFREVREYVPAEVAVRKKYISNLQQITQRNIVLYYSAWLQRGGNVPFGIDDTDMNGFMVAFKELAPSKGLDLILHTPGGVLSATEAIIRYIRSVFGTNIRVIVPQLAMSAGTLVALAAKEIIMGHHSNLGPIDPQIMNLPAQAILTEFETAKREIKKDPSSIPLWQVIIQKYHPAFLNNCHRAVNWSRELAKELLLTGMFEQAAGDHQAVEESIVDSIVASLADPDVSKSHDRHFSAEACKAFGLKINLLNADKELHDAVLAVHHAVLCSMSQSSTIVKLIENHNNQSYIMGVSK